MPCIIVWLLFVLNKIHIKTNLGLRIISSSRGNFVWYFPEAGGLKILGLLSPSSSLVVPWPTEMIWSETVPVLKVQIHLGSLYSERKPAGIPSTKGITYNSLPLQSAGFGSPPYPWEAVETQIVFRAGIIPSKLVKVLRAEGGLNRGFASLGSRPSSEILWSLFTVLGITPRASDTRAKCSALSCTSTPWLRFVLTSLSYLLAHWWI